MDQRKHHTQGNNSFVLGLILGVLITLLFTTKKGRQILRSFTEEGHGKFSELEAMFTGEAERADFEKRRDADSESEVLAGNDYITETEISEERTEQKPQVKKQHVSGRRFFRGAPKR